MVRVKKKNWFLRIFLFLLLVVVCVLVYTGLNFFKNLEQGFKQSSSTVEVDQSFKTFSALLIGIDENESRKAEGQTRENSRTDSLIYLALNKDRNRMDMVSIPRDSLTLMRDKNDRLDKNSYFFDKITHAHAYSGVDGTIEAVSNLINAPVNFYAVINFAAFEDVVNALGGVNLYVPFDMIEQNANGEQGTVELKQGWHILDGEKALAFARSRYYDSDIERGQRQLQVLHSVIDKAKSLNMLYKVNDLIKIGGTNVTHNMSAKQLASAMSIFATNSIDIVSHRIGGYDAQLNGIYYYYPKPSHLLYISSVLNDTLGNKIPSGNELLNIYYQGHINPLNKIYRKKNSTQSYINKFPTYPYVQLTLDDYKENLYNLRLTKEDLKEDPTISNENKPENLPSAEKKLN